MHAHSVSQVGSHLLHEPRPQRPSTFSQDTDIGRGKLAPVRRSTTFDSRG